MIFDKNSLKITNKADSSIHFEFNVLDAIKLIKNTPIDLKLPVSEEWRAARQECVSNIEVYKPFDWTFSTEYCGTFSDSFREEATTETLDRKFLSKLEPIKFFVELPLFEDELGDNGLSELHLKIRVMPSGFFILLRFFLRVDQLILRIYDTRLHFKYGENYLLKDVYQCESKEWSSDFERITLWEADPAVLKVINHKTTKLYFK
ncbi:hypothetical protein Ciccas_012344 [Cichlidogyrus casuarinus]|uniref:TIP41-like protein n=1 Tax=Cichlidogyrus casuarinus TaxID=1844966 RepID=A0ABD2PTL3_9PLAT